VVANSLLAEFLSITSINPTQINVEAAATVITFVSCILLIFIVGLWFFHRWDYLDREYLLYVAHAKRKKDAHNATDHDVDALRKRIDMAFLTGAIKVTDFDEDDYEFDRRRHWWALLLKCLVPDYVRSNKSLLKAGDFVGRLVQATLRFHPFLCFFTGRSMVRTRTLRFLALFKSLMVSLFTSTLVFGK
jgi:ABC-type nickel/cobalt efflux system permease component RcnA